MDEEEKANAAYQAALQLISYEGALIWSAFTAILAANAFLVSFDGILLRLFPHSWIAGASISIAGIALCAAWVLVLSRQFSYYRFWFACTRSFGKFLPSSQNITELGRIYGEGATVLVGGTYLRMSWAARAFRVQWLASAIILIFAGIYVGILCSFLLSGRVP